MIINPNASISLGAPLPSDPNKVASYRLPLDPTVQGMPPLTEEFKGFIFWVLTVHVLELRRQVDRLERLMAHVLDETGTGKGDDNGASLESAALRAQLGAEVRARREAEAKAAAELAEAGGVQ